MVDEVQKSFVKSFIEFLKNQIQTQSLPSDGLESLEVAIQCLEAAFELFADESKDSTISGVSSTNVSNLEASSSVVPDSSMAKCESIDLFDLYQGMYVDSNPNRKELGENIKNDGNRLMKEGKFQEALFQYNKSITYDPTNPVFYCNRAAAYIRVGEHEKAVSDCKMALAYNPEYGKAHGRMGIAYSNLNKFNEARASYQRALELEPDNQDYRNNLRVAEERVSSGHTGEPHFEMPANLINLGQAFAAAQGGQAGGGGNLGPGNMRDFLGNMMRDPVISSALQSLASNPEGLLDMSRQVAAAIASDNPDFIRNVQETLNVNFQQPPNDQQNNGNGQPPPADGNGPN